MKNDRERRKIHTLKERERERLWIEERERGGEGATEIDRRLEGEKKRG